MNTAVNVTTAAASTADADKKSGIRKLAAGEVLFNQNDAADSLYIIQKGQIRLYIPKGRGFVDLAILRAGEVIGEMAYFDEKSRRRSASAAAIVSTEIIEISFKAFAKTMANLNPWFKTIINTLAERLRKTNDKVKQLENNSVGFGKGGKVADYKFLQGADLVKIFSALYLVFSTHREERNGMQCVSTQKIKFYTCEIINVQEIKYEELVELLKQEKVFEVANDKDGLPNILAIKNIDLIKNYMVFFNTQRNLADDKQLVVSNNCEIFLKKIIDQMVNAKVTTPTAEANISLILGEFKDKNIRIGQDDLEDALREGLMEELVVGKGGLLTSIIQYDKLKKLYPNIRLLNLIKKLNESKAK